MLANWASAFPGFEPVADEAKVRFPNRWVRFHSLPGSQRYPEDEVDFALLLSRFNTVAAAVVADQARVVLLTTEFSDVRQPPTPPTSTPAATHWRTAFINDTFWHTFATVLDWQPGIFDSLVRSVAVDAASNVMICDPGCAWLLHPYDGGLDVILDQTSTRDRLKARFASWLSAQPDGR